MTMNNKLFLNKYIYDYKSVDKSINAFGQIASISICDDEEYWICIFHKTKAPMLKTILEFENYLIAITNQRGMADAFM